MLRWMAVVAVRRIAVELAVDYLVIVAVGRVTVYALVTFVKFSHALAVELLLWLIAVRGLVLVIRRAVAA